ncbi:hypothetical protein E2320_007088, partial [Naja naja]
ILKYLESCKQLLSFLKRDHLSYFVLFTFPCISRDMHSSPKSRKQQGTVRNSFMVDVEEIKTTLKLWINAELHVNLLGNIDSNS